MPRSKYQKKQIDGLLQLIADNPDLDIVPMVNSEVVADDGYNWWVAGWENASIDAIWWDDEQVYIRSRDEDTLVENAYEKIDDDTMTDEARDAKAIDIVKAYEWERCIIVNITTP